jgi:hypothetical protein
VLRRSFLLLIAFCASAAARDESGKFVGSVGCKSSSCHGGAGEKRSQYITWSQKDFHTRAYTILLDARSARIGEALGAPQPQSSARCTVCHSPFESVAADPELVFEFDSQSINEPKHWRDDDPASGPQSWLIGQAVALREIMWAVNNATGQERDRLFTQASALTWMLDKAGLGGNVSSFSSIPGIQLHADGIARDAANWSPTNDQLMSILQTLAASDSEFQTANTTRADNFYRALRLTLALDRLSAALNLLPKLDKELSVLRTDVQRHYDFDNIAFAKHLRDFRQKL